MGRSEGKIATGRFRINMAGAREGSSFSREVNNAIHEGKLPCSHRSCIGNLLYKLECFIEISMTEKNRNWYM